MNYSPETHFVVNLDDNGFWDGYTGQETVIMNEFRGQITFSNLLRLADKWPETVKIKGAPPVPFLAKKIIITSALSPYEIYKNVLQHNDSIEQLERRFKIFQIKENKGPLIELTKNIDV